MRGKSLGLLFLALGCGLVASIGITQVLAKRNVGQQVSNGDTGTIFVALKDIALGEPLNSQVLRLEQWPKDKIPAGAMTKIEEIEGRRSRTKLYAGEPLLEKKLYTKGSHAGGVTPLIPKGYRVVSARVDSVSSGGSMIRPGDRVDVLVHLRRNPGTGVMETSTRTILQDIKVFAVNDLVELDSVDNSPQTISAKTISLLVTPADAEKVMLATQLGAIQLVMRSPEDEEQVVLDGTPAHDLYGPTHSDSRGDEKAARSMSSGNQTGSSFLQFLKQSQAPKQDLASNAPGESNQFHMRLMQGPEVSVLTLEDDLQGNSSGGLKFWKTSGAGSKSSGSTSSLAPPEEENTPDKEESTSAPDIEESE